MNDVDYIDYKLREIYISDIDDGISTVIEKAIRHWNKEDWLLPIEKRSIIKLYINSEGGLLDEAFTIIDAINMSETPIYTINTGKAYSAAFYIFIAGHRRYAYHNSSFLIHQGIIDTGEKTATQFFDYSNFYREQLERAVKHIIANTHVTMEQINQHIYNDWYFYADSKEGTEYGIFDYIINRFI